MIVTNDFLPFHLWCSNRFPFILISLSQIQSKYDLKTRIVFYSNLFSWVFFVFQVFILLIDDQNIEYFAVILINCYSTHLSGAEKMCKSIRGTLISIHSTEENYFALDLANRENP